MSTLGDTLREAREAKQASPSEAARATRLKVQHIDALETNDYSKMPAPIYARGFIKLYAEYLGLEPAPLLERYDREHKPATRPSIAQPEETLEQRADKERRQSRPPREPVWPRVRAAFAGVRNIDFTRIPWQKIGLALAVVLVVILLVSGIRACRTGAKKTPPAAPPRRISTHDIIEEPPEPYVDRWIQSEAAP